MLNKSRKHHSGVQLEVNERYCVLVVIAFSLFL